MLKAGVEERKSPQHAVPEHESDRDVTEEKKSPQQVALEHKSDREVVLIFTPACDTRAQS